MNNIKQTERHIRENHFFGFRGSQNVDIWQKWGGGGHILHKSNIFSDENVKNVSFLKAFKTAFFEIEVI